MMPKCRALVVFGVLLALAAVRPSHGENWPQWRGPRFNGTSIEKNLPTTWSPTENVRWRLAMPGPAGSTPVIWDDRIFVTSADGDDLVLIGASTQGKELWRRVIASGNRVVRGDEGNSASPSCSTDGKHVWTFMATGHLGCYTIDGQKVWQYNLQDKYGRFNIQFGMTSTPVLYDGRLYVQCMYTGASYLLSLDAASGRELWKHDRQSDARAECEHSYASPVLYRDGKQDLILTHGADYIVAHDPQTGDELWRCGGLNPPDNYNETLRLVASPAVAPGLVVVPSAKNGPVLALRPDVRGNVTDQPQAKLWVRAQNTPDVPSPTIHDGLVYLCRENGNLLVLDAKTGEQVYEERTQRDRHRASPVYADGKVYLSARSGKVSVVRAGRQFELLATNDLGEDLSSSPAISNGVIYLRTFDALYAIAGAK